MSCTRLSLFTNVTREPVDTVTERGDTPLEVMVIVVPVVGVGVGVGELGVEPLLPPPQDAVVSTSAIAKQRESAVLVCIRKPSCRRRRHAESAVLPAHSTASRKRSTVCATDGAQRTRRSAFDPD